MTKLTRKQEKTIQPKLKTYAEKEEARQEMLDQVDQFIKNGGEIQAVEQGATALRYGKTTKWRQELADKGKSGAASTHKK